MTCPVISGPCLAAALPWLLYRVVRAQWACWLQYRMSKDYLDPQFLGPRTMDKLAIAFIIMTLCERPRMCPAPNAPRLPCEPRLLCDPERTGTDSPMGTDWKIGKGLRVNPDASDVAARELQFTNASNIGAMLFVWTILPAFAASTYIPSLVIERTIYYRHSLAGCVKLYARLSPAIPIHAHSVAVVQGEG